MIYITLPDEVHNNYGIEIHNCTIEQAFKFQNWIVVNVFQHRIYREQLKPFFQGGFNCDIKWRYVEFMCEKTENNQLIMWQIAEGVSNYLHCDFDIA